MTQQPPLHGGQLRQIAVRFGIPITQLLDFSASINPDGPPPAVLANLRASLDEPSALTTYPDLDQLELKQAIGRFAGVFVSDDHCRQWVLCHCWNPPCACSR